MRWVSSILAVGLLSACTAHNPFNVMPVTDATPAASGQVFAPTTNRIRLLAGGLPPGTDYVVIAKIEVSRSSYGDLDAAKRMIADRARKLGADAVIHASAWHAPSGFSWAAPHGSGDAVKLTKPESVDLEALPGEWF